MLHHYPHFVHRLRLLILAVFMIVVLPGSALAFSGTGWSAGGLTTNTGSVAKLTTNYWSMGYNADNTAGSGCQSLGGDIFSYTRDYWITLDNNVATRYQAGTATQLCQSSFPNYGGWGDFDTSNFVSIMNSAFPGWDITQPHTVRFSMGAASTTGTGFNEEYWMQIELNGGANYTTRIVDFTPEDGSTTPSSTAVTFSAHLYIDPADVGTFQIHFRLHNNDQNVFLASFLSPADFNVFNGFATTTGDWYFSTTSIIADGNYSVLASLQQGYPLIGGEFIDIPSFLGGINSNLTHQFIVGSSTFIGSITQNTNSDINALFASTTATSTAALAGSCNPLGNFSIINCGAFLFVPGGPYISDVMTQFHDAVLARAPWGYLTRFVDIMNSTATSSLPAFTVNVAMNNASDTTTLSFDPGDMLAGGAAALDSVQDPYNGKTARDVLEPFIQLTLALALIFAIIRDLTGMGHGGSVNTRRRVSKQ